MSAMDDDLSRRLQELSDSGLRRQLRTVESAQGRAIQIDGKDVLNFSSNDYLGLANHPALKEAARLAIDRFGAGAGASRLISGSLECFHALEETLAEFKQTEAALTFSTGYAAALGTIPALVEKDDVVIVDKLVHACCVDAARLSGAKLRVFDHNDLNDLESVLKWADSRKPSKDGGKRSRVLIITESVFSMDGDLAPLRNLVDLKDCYGAWLMVDEAHGIGLFGERRTGVAEAMEVADRIDVHMGTLGKAVGSSGGYIAGSRVLIDFLINRARSFIFSTAPVPAAAAAAKAGIEVIRSAEGEQRRQRLWMLVDRVKNGLLEGPWQLPVVRSAILPLMVGREDRALEFAHLLREKGLHVPAIRYPTVARGEARLRLTMTADHSLEDIIALETVVRDLKTLTGESDASARKT
ncbi:MAG TPA: 8-amino-7-oxononanoate synthase [Roseimicrobium sp.]|nr:8-amino-7-oxononanoate synthase [Roseimicrobium sp.]